MTSLMTSIRAGLATRVATVPAFLGRSHTVFPERLGASMPIAIVNIPSWEYHLAARSRIEAEVLILAHPLGKGTTLAQEALDRYLDDVSSDSVKLAIEAEPTLGGVVQDVIVQGWSEYGEVEVNGISYLGAVLRVEVVA